MKTKALILAALCGLAVALALPAGGVAANPPTVEPFHFTLTLPGNLCGIDGTDLITATGVNVYDTARWDRINAYHFADTFTNPATGKWVEFVSGNLDEFNIVDNGDGTTSIYASFSGANVIRQSNGPPIGGNYAGHDLSVATVDNTTGALIGFQDLFSAGPLADQSPSAVCGQIVAALT